MAAVEARPRSITVALAGNPNTGKTTVFNNLTGSRQRVGNYPGVTVEKKEGRCRYHGINIHVVDLPGIYSLTAQAPDERAAREFLINGSPDVVVNIADASNLERNLCLTTQLMEMGIPLVLAINMTDTARSRGIQIDARSLSEVLGVPVVLMVSTRNEGTHDLLEAVVSAISVPQAYTPKCVSFNEEIEARIAEVVDALDTHKERLFATRRWQAVKLIERDEDMMAKVQSPEARRQIEHCRASIEQKAGSRADSAIVMRRYGFVRDACLRSIRSRPETYKQLSDRVDSLVTHRILGIPLFIGLMFLVFHLTFTLGGLLTSSVESILLHSAKGIESIWPNGADSVIRSLLEDGIMAGLGAVLAFLPNVVLLFLAISVLEDTGYTARVAFMMDRVMRSIGLNGKSCIPFVIGFGCSVPAIMATRTLENRRDRLITIMVLPFISCGARLPVYALIIPVFFPRELQSTILMLIYLTGFAAAILCAKLLGATVLKGASAPFMMELPPYRMPGLRSIVLHVSERSRLYLVRAGTIILAVSVILWACASFPEKSVFEQDYDELAEQAKTRYSGKDLGNRLSEIDEMRRAEAMAYSISGRVGRAIEPIINPIGFDWKIGVALIGAMAGKEVLVAQLGIIHSVDASDSSTTKLRTRLRDSYSPLSAFCVMLFTLIGTPCMATFAATRLESNSWKWAVFQFIGLTVIAYVVTLIVYQTGTLFHIGDQIRR